MYYIAELQNRSSKRKPEETKAKTINGAKIAAERKRIFKGTVLAIYDKYNRMIALKDHGKWQNVSEG
jgi:hypothetical protein